ncbi:MAG: 23S rRNA (pseudouridine(1915)-N(3))-methyltransferase RlmH [Calditrichaeota bacterium]|nr:23S rRNA (pseudouridine(1915)-N(3))-methyltransferase RlmH [Calditrichota bacterium]
MKCHILTVGKIENNNFKEMCDLYVKRIAHYIPIELNSVRSEKISSLSVNEIKSNEAKRLLQKLSKKDYAIALDKEGVSYSSEDFARFIGKKISQSSKTLTFIIGGPLGLGEEVLQTAQMKLSLSQMTFAHELTAVILLEQLYRGMTILRGGKYHK